MRRTKLCVAGALVGLLIIMSVGGNVLAATPSTNPTTSQGLQISPVLINLNADKGKTYDLKVSLLNITTGNLVFTSAINDFKARDETGTPEILLNSTLPPTASVVSWVQPIGSISLAAKQSKDLDVYVNVPANAESGGHYGVIRFSGAAPGVQQTGVGLQASAGILLLVRVSGQITESLNLKQFFAEHSGKQGSWFQSSPITFVERIDNTGNVHVVPTGNLTVTNMLGKTVATLGVNQASGNVLPSSIRRFEETWQKKWLFGRYTASVNLAYGTEGKVLVGSMSFWIIPLKLILVLLLVIIVLVLIIWRLARRYNRRVIRRAGGRYRR